MAENNIKYPFLDLRKVNEPYIAELKQLAAKVIDSGRYIGGPEVEALEESMTELTGAQYCVGVSNGLDALRLIFQAYKQLGRLRDADEVIVPANTYIASVLAVTDSGLTPVLVDPDPTTMNLSGPVLAKAITPRTRAVLTVHLYGRTAFDPTMLRLVRDHGLVLVEDAAQAIGASAPLPGIAGRSAMVGALGHAAAFSFYPTKNIGALGDAGAVTTDDADLAAAVRALANYGSDRRYHNIYQGYNCRLDPIQAAFVGLKLRSIGSVNSQRWRLAEVYDSHICNPLVVKPQLPEKAEYNVWHQYPVLVDERDRFRSYLLSCGVQTDVNYPTPPHLQPCYAEFARLDLPVTCRIADSVVCLPITSATLSADAKAISNIINDFS